MSVDTSSEMEDEPSSLSQTNHPSSLSRQSSTTSYFDSQDSAPLLEHAEKKRKFAKEKIAAAEPNQWVAIIPGMFWDKTNYIGHNCKACSVSLWPQNKYFVLIHTQYH